MREIKFRVWDGERMIYPKPGGDVWITLDAGGNLIGMTTEPALGGGRCNKVLAEIMQYTGLKDSEGQEIYEGDIVEGSALICPNDEDQAVVTYEHGAFMPFFRFGWEGEEQWLPSECRVIGNIYENPQLLDE